MTYMCRFYVFHSYKLHKTKMTMEATSVKVITINWLAHAIHNRIGCIQSFGHHRLKPNV